MNVMKMNLRFENFTQKTRQALLFALLLSVPAGLIGQPYQNNTGERGAAPVGPSPVRDPMAIELLQRSLVAMGGDANWSAIRNTLITGTLLARPGQAPSQINWLEDWSTGTLRYADMTSDQSTGIHARRFDGQTLRRTTVRGRQIVIPELDPAATLATRLPAPAIWWILNHPDYSVAINKFRGRSGFECIDVVAPTHQFPVIPVLELYIATSSALPDHAAVALPDILSPIRRLWATAAYRDFKQQDGVSYPSSVILQWPSAVPQLVTIEALQFNHAALPGEFTQTDQRGNR
jgi:hypothetical protein